MTFNTTGLLLPVPPPRFARLFTSNIPDMKDPVWGIETTALVEQIANRNGAMSIDDIVTWGESHGDSGSVIRHKLAWLSVKGRVFYDNLRNVWRIP